MSTTAPILEQSLTRLRFSNSDTERCYRDFLGERMRLEWRLLFLCGIVLVSLGGIPEFFFLETNALVTAVVVRYLVLVGGMALAFYVSFSPSFSQIAPLVCGGVLVLLGVGFLALSMLYPSVWDPSIYGDLEKRLPMAEARFVLPQIINVCTISAALSFGALTYRASLVVAVVYIAILFVNYWLIQPSVVTLFYSAVLALPALVITVLAAYRLEFLQRRSFINRCKLPQAAKPKKPAPSFSTAFAQEALTGVRMIILAGVFIITGAGLSEIVILPDQNFMDALILRYGLVVPYLLLLFWLTFTPFYYRHLDLMMGSGILLTSLGQLLVTAQYPDAKHFAKMFGVTSALPANEGMFGFMQIFNLSLMIATVATGALRKNSAITIVIMMLGTAPLAYYLFQPHPVAALYILALSVPATALTAWGSIQTEKLKRADFEGAYKPSNPSSKPLY